MVKILGNVLLREAGGEVDTPILRAALKGKKKASPVPKKNIKKMKKMYVEDPDISSDDDFVESHPRKVVWVSDDESAVLDPPTRVRPMSGLGNRRMKGSKLKAATKPQVPSEADPQVPSEADPQVPSEADPQVPSEAEPQVFVVPQVPVDTVPQVSADDDVSQVFADVNQVLADTKPQVSTIEYQAESAFPVELVQLNTQTLEVLYDYGMDCEFVLQPTDTEITTLFDDLLKKEQTLCDEEKHCEEAIWTIRNEQLEIRNQQVVIRDQLEKLTAQLNLLNSQQEKLNVLNAAKECDLATIRTKKFSELAILDKMRKKLYM